MGRCVRNKFFAVRHLSSGTTQGLFDSLKRVVEYMKLDKWKTKMIGFDTVEAHSCVDNSEIHL